MWKVEGREEWETKIVGLNRNQIGNLLGLCKSKEKRRDGRNVQVPES